MLWWSRSICHLLIDCWLPQKVVCQMVRNKMSDNKHQRLLTTFLRTIVKQRGRLWVIILNLKGLNITKIWSKLKSFFLCYQLLKFILRIHIDDWKRIVIILQLGKNMLQIWTMLFILYFGTWASSGEGFWLM